MLSHELHVLEAFHRKAADWKRANMCLRLCVNGWEIMNVLRLFLSVHLAVRFSVCPFVPLALFLRMNSIIGSSLSALHTLNCTRSRFGTAHVNCARSRFGTAHVKLYEIPIRYCTR